jgi:hypothetical protein
MRFFTELLKLSIFIGLILLAAYLTGNWDNLIRLLKEGQIQLKNLTDQVMESANSFSD